MDYLPRYVPKVEYLGMGIYIQALTERLLGSRSQSIHYPILMYVYFILNK